MRLYYDNEPIVFPKIREYTESKVLSILLQTYVGSKNSLVPKKSISTGLEKTKEEHVGKLHIYC